MDEKTIKIYDEQARTIAERHLKATPTRLYNLCQTFFKSGAPTADLGSGVGRDTFWLNDNGYPATGFEPSQGMLKIAQEHFPQLTFKSACLPRIENLEGQFTNLFCCAVLMHIPRNQLVTSIVNLLKAVKTEGRIILSYRSGNGEEDGRLFETYHPGQIAQLFESLGGKVLLLEKEGIWHNLVIEKSNQSQREGIQKIQDIISRDKKTATYKFALLRALCEISRYESHIVTWYRDGDMVLVPLKRIAVRWVYYYWPLVKAGVKQTSGANVAFADKMLSVPLKVSDMPILRTELEGNIDSKLYHDLVKKVAHTIKVGPVTFAGGGETPAFQYMSGLDASVYNDLKESEMGMVAVPIGLWRDLCLFSHWIEDSLSIQWAELTEKLNKDGKFAFYLDLITRSIQEDERSTYLVRQLFKNKEVECVWTGKRIKDFAVDHMLPWTLWRNNDLWNLFPSDIKVNLKKSDNLPSLKLTIKRFDSIRGYWEKYIEEHSDLFEKQVIRGLGINSSDCLGSRGREALEQAILKVNQSMGGKYWEP